MTKKRSTKKAPKKEPNEPKPFHEVADDIDGYATGDLLSRLGSDLWDFLDSFGSPVYTVSPGTVEEAQIRPVAERVMLERQTVNGKEIWRLREWSEVKDELARRDD